MRLIDADELIKWLEAETLIEFDPEWDPAYNCACQYTIDHIKDMKTFEGSVPQQPPTEKQVEYVKAICDWSGSQPPTEFTKKAYSEWLDRNIPAYRKSMREHNLYLGIEAESING